MTTIQIAKEKERFLEKSISLLKFEHRQHPSFGISDTREIYEGMQGMRTF